MIDLKKVGSSQQASVTSVFDSTYGIYKDAVDAEPIEGARLPTDQMPKATDPSPFSLGPMAAGDR